MRRPSFEREGIEAEIDRVRSLGVESLRSLWRTTFRESPPPAFSKDILARFLCWHIQEQAFGGLDSKTAKHLNRLARVCRISLRRRHGLPHRLSCRTLWPAAGALLPWDRLCCPGIHPIPFPHS